MQIFFITFLYICVCVHVYIFMFFIFAYKNIIFFAPFAPCAINPHIQMLSEQKDDDIDADLFQLFRYRCSSSSDLIRYSIYRQIGYILDKYDHRKIKGDLDNGKHNPKKE